MLREPYAILKAGATGLEAAGAWANLALVFGDTRAVPLALIVCLHAERGLPEGVEHRRLAAHRDLCLLDLRLASTSGAVKIADLGKPGTVDENLGLLEAWLARALMPFDGDLARAADYALELAGERLALTGS